MKREILFRGKRIDNGEWINGYLIHHLNVTGIIPVHNICFTCDGMSLDFAYIDVMPETVGQFTGLTDKNGKKIFENDILNIFWGVGLGDTAEVITYCEKYGYYKYGNNPICEILEDEKVSYLVIGNIHEK